MRRILRRLPVHRRDDRGMALAMVLIFGMVLFVVATTALSFSVGGLRKADTDQDTAGAMSAAYAGVEDYQSRLSNDNAYWRYGNPGDPLSTTTGSTVTLPTGGQANPAFNYQAGAPWATVPTSAQAGFPAYTGANVPQYRYEVDNSSYSATGVIRLRVTGKVGTSTRSLVAQFRQQGFIDFLYFTDYEIQDPQLTGANVTQCSQYAWAGRPFSGCGAIAFAGGDTINGPVQSNDTIRICNATFKGLVTTSDPTSGLRYAKVDSNGAACTGQSFSSAYNPAAQPNYRATIGMPATNAQMKRETRSDLPSDVPRPGCLYTGPTRITFLADGRVTVVSPFTKATNTVGADPATSGSAPSACGSISALQSSAGATFTPPANNLIYVQSVPTIASDPNYTAPASTPSSCAGSNCVGYPISNETVPTNAGTTGAYGQRTGDVFVQGQFHGQETIAADNFIYVTGNITYVDKNSDVLGLVGQNAIWVWNPVKCPSAYATCSAANSTSLLSDANREIDAALISVSHTIQVQNFDRGDPRGTLTVFGAIAQKYRGTTGTYSGSTPTSGYVKAYSYDPRLRYLAPPKFLSPVTTTYGVTTLAEVRAAFSGLGAPQ